MMKIKAFGKDIEINGSVIDSYEEEIRRQIEEYLEGGRRSFEFDVAFQDGFTGDVMRQMAGIGYGDTKTYGEIADTLGSSPIAVGQACSRNPVPIIVPCHRVVGKDSLGGYSGGLELKKKLLELEQKPV